MSHVKMQGSIVVVGVGPAGIAAAWAAAEAGGDVLMVDNGAAAGGQIWRGGKALDRLSTKWLRRLERAKGIRRVGALVVSAEADRKLLLAETAEGGSVGVRYEKLILATGARERFLPFAGWTLPGVVGAGGLQALVKSGLDVRGKRVVLAGSGPLLLAVADLLREREATVVLIAEQARMAAIMRFGMKLASAPAKLIQAVVLKARLATVPYLTGCWVERAEGAERLKSVMLNQGGRRWRVECDYLGTGFGLIPNMELAGLLGCETGPGGVVVDARQRTSVEGVYCAGEAAGIGGVDKSLAEGEIAGWAAAGQEDTARALEGVRAKQLGFAAALGEAFGLREELKGLVTAETVVCRCEDVRMGALEGMEDWREAKLQTRCGMGRCQGRVCGGALEFLKGWTPAVVKPPVFPARVATMVAEDEV
ncbi:MAG: FAD/NAD(P)-binding oxidoreductase [Candidatus Solibacter sp.]|nr:FAD/NAD(P)-binding oxidoreductase [Candidatus Solibacter sp.]